MQHVLPFPGRLPHSALTETAGQRDAVTSWRRGDVCVMAGPGSGKTRVLVERFRWLVEHKGVDPRSILAITFTEKAANNMRERLVYAVTDAATKQAFQRAPISTIHAFCAQLLREHAFEIGLDPEFSLMEDWEPILERRRIIAEVLDQRYSDEPAAAEQFLRAFGGSDVQGQIENIYESMRACDGTPFSETNDPQTACRELISRLRESARLFSDPDLRDFVGRFEAARLPPGVEQLALLEEIAAVVADIRARGPNKETLDSLRKSALPRCRAAIVAFCHQSSLEWLVKTLECVEERYSAWKRSVSKLDFNDLERYAVRLLKDAPNLRARFLHVLVDEYQDTNRVQSELIKLLRPEGVGDGRALFAVGDINQSIYGFRYAAPEVFRRYRGDLKAHGGHLVELRENFRSRANILLAVETILDGEQGIEPRSLIAARSFPPKDVPSVEVLVVHHSVKEAVLHQEALHVAARIIEFRRELRIGDPPRSPKWSDFAVLLRTRNLIEEFSSGFREAGVPYQLSAGRGFYDAPEVRDLTHFLRVLANPLDEISMAAVLCSPLVGITDETLLRLKEKGANLATGLRSPVDVDAEDRQRLEEFRPRLDHFRRTRDEAAPDLLLSRLIAETGYETYLWSQPTGGHQVANVRKFLELLRRISQKTDLSFDQIVIRVEELRTSKSPEAEAPVHDEASDAVQVMTLHAAKGLEFPIVILPALTRGTNYMRDEAGYDPVRGIGAKWKDRLTGEPADDPVLSAIRTQVRQREAEESNRLFYVAMTRAEEHLVLSCSFGQRVRTTHWARVVRDKLQLDFQQSIENSPQERCVKGLRFRLLQTDRPPEFPAIGEALSGEETPPWIDPLGPPSDQSDSAAAVTSIAVFSQCPRRYYLSRYLGFGQTAEPRAAQLENETSTQNDDLDATELGRQVHSILAGSQPPDTPNSEVMELVRRFQESDLGKRVQPDAHHEQNLLFAFEGRLLRGQVDLWFDDGDERILVDYKTDQVTAEEVPERARHYELQLQLYAHAIEQATERRPDRAVLYFLRPNLAVDVSLDLGAMQAAGSAVADFFNAQSKVRFPLRVGKHCYRCPHYRNLCPAKVAVEPHSQSEGAESNTSALESKPPSPEGEGFDG